MEHHMKFFGDSNRHKTVSKGCPGGINGQMK